MSSHAFASDLTCTGTHFSPERKTPRQSRCPTFLFLIGCYQVVVLSEKLNFAALKVQPECMLFSGHSMTKETRLEGTKTPLTRPYCCFIVRSPFTAKNHVVVQYMPRWMKCPLIPPLPLPQHPSPSPNPVPLPDSPPPLPDPPPPAGPNHGEDNEDKGESMTLLAQGTSHCSCLEHCFLLLNSECLVVEEDSVTTRRQSCFPARIPSQHLCPEITESWEVLKQNYQLTDKYIYTCRKRQSAWDIHTAWRFKFALN